MSAWGEGRRGIGGRGRCMGSTCVCIVKRSFLRAVTGSRKVYDDMNGKVSVAGTDARC